MAFAMFIFCKYHCTGWQLASFAVTCRKTNPAIEEDNELTSRRVMRSRDLIERLHCEELHSADIDALRNPKFGNTTFCRVHHTTKSYLFKVALAISVRPNTQVIHYVRLPPLTKRTK